MALQPAILFGFMGTQVIKYDMDFLIRTIGNDLIHKIQKLTASAAVIVASLHHPGGYIQGSKQGSRAMTLILVTKASHGLAIRKTQPALGTFQGLDRRLLINTDDQGILRRLKIEAHDISRLLGKLGVCAHAPTPPSLQVNVLLAQHSPNMVIGDISQTLGQQLSRPFDIPLRRRIIHCGQDTPLCSFIIFLISSLPWSIGKTLDPLLEKAQTPLAYRGRSQCQTMGDLLGHSSRRAFQHDARPLYQTLLGGRRTHPRFQLPPFFGSQINFFSFTRHNQSIHLNVNYCN
jgi:hypothetical protein